MVLGIGISIFLLASGLMVNIWIYITLVVGFIIFPPLLMMYSQAHTADERTLQVQFGDKPPMPANDHSAGKYTIVRDYRFINPDDDSQDEQEESIILEAGRMGDLAGAWPRSLRALFWIAIAQFVKGDNGSGAIPQHAGYIVGNTYHIPVKPKQMRFKVFQKIFPDIARQLKAIRGIGEDIRPGSWILYSWEAVTIPEGVPQGDGHVTEFELWEAQMRNNKLMNDLLDYGAEDRVVGEFERSYQ
jgi:hypothetical protein